MKKSSHTREALKNIKQIGSISSSSQYLARKMTKDIEFDKKIKVLELGAGNGVITKEILKNLNQDSVVTSYEIHETFARDLRQIKDDRLSVMQENVTELSKLEDNSYDVVVSSLPLAMFDKAFKADIYSNIKKKLVKNGLFVQYQYSLLDYKEINKYFKNCKLDFCLLNVPPAFVYKVRLVG
ncbi:MAG: phospholipid N-methyltransferase [Patiriisocius sp.]|jgi:phospholipid N-methyltransferase